MAAPVIDSIVVTPASAPVGAKLTATVKYHDADATVYTLNDVATDPEGNKSLAMSATFTVTDGPISHALSDGSGRVWTKISDDGATYVATATA